jgi:hypothetical protein
MFLLIEFPELVQHYAPYFADVFSAEAFIQFERYIIWAHDLVNLHYSDEDTDYPVRFQVWKPADNGLRPIPTSSCLWRLTTGTPNPASAATWTRPCSCRMWGHSPTTTRSS